jgi:hypothetical protein
VRRLETDVEASLLGNIHKVQMSVTFDGQGKHSLFRGWS